MSQEIIYELQLLLQTTIHKRMYRYDTPVQKANITFYIIF